MSFDLEKIFRAKCEQRQQLAALPIVEKLALLDALRERALTIGQARQAAAGVSGMTLREQASEYGLHKPAKKKP
ncbi:MAG: hypothetical protein JWQ04_3161 [Pedosphaera sp.]|nr:hypothetical protein [Pedosphaera sp.]